MRKSHIFFVAVSLLVCIGCSPRDFLTRRLAADLIAASSAFNMPQTYSLQTGSFSNQQYLVAEPQVLQRHGWISANTVPCPPGISPPPCWDVLLTPSGIETVRSIVGSQPNEASTWQIPARRRELVAITGIARDGNRADVEFAWKWIPLNEIGAALYPDSDQHTSTVAFRDFDDGWRVVENSQAGQSLQDALKSVEPSH